MGKALFELEAREITKTYNLRPVIRDISFGLSSGEVLGITGVNGSGKTTLLKSLASVLDLSAGNVERRRAGEVIEEEDYPECTGFVAPYLSLYTEFSGRELARLLCDLRGVAYNQAGSDLVAKDVDILQHFDRPIGELSSGMQQRIRYVLALAHSPPFLFLDEPMTNLDAEGKRAVRALISESAPDRITVIATNDRPDLDLCTKVLDLNG